jgi:hypothetical protein
MTQAFIGTTTAALALAGAAFLLPEAHAAVHAGVCAPEVDPPAYYAVELVTTRNIPATGRATGVGEVTFASSPFGVALSPDGSYHYQVRIRLSGMKAPPQGTLVAWATTTEVDQVRRLGALDDRLTTTGPVDWNKFLLVVTLEETDDPSATAWSGPIVLRGMSRSGMMHTMAGHGPFQQELCAKYGYS